MTTKQARTATHATLDHGSYGWTVREGRALGGVRQWIPVDAIVRILGTGNGRTLVTREAEEQPALFAWIDTDELSPVIA